MNRFVEADELLEVFKTLADKTRLRLLAILARGEFTVQELTAVLQMGQSRISRHLRILFDAGFVTLKKQGTWSYYRLDPMGGLFGKLWPVIEPEIASLPETEEDLARVLRILEERSQRSRQFFDRHAGQWDELARRLLPTPDYRLRLLSLVDGGDPVVEVGIGTGRLLGLLLDNAHKVIGIDHSPAMLAEAQVRLENENLRPLDLRLGEMGHLPLSDGEAGCVILDRVLHHAPDPSAVLREVYRVLRPGGVLVLADLGRHEQEWVREQMADQWLGFDEKELEKWLHGAGFALQRFVHMPPDEGEYGIVMLQAHRPDIG